MNKVLRLVLLCLTLMIALPALAQEIQVKGRVIDEKGEAVIGAAVKVKESTKGALTDLDGNFTVSAPRKGHLIISFMGFKSQTIDLSTSKLPLKITLQEESQSLKEVVVVGYGSMQKKDLTGSISSISEKNFQKGAISTASELLVGKVAGVQITPDGSPGAGGRIRIRGGASLNASNDPLIVIDGVPIENTAVSGAPNILSTINPQDIASMNVLKDASATAIYGSRASNGVIMITTKRGKLGQKTQIAVSVQNSLSEAARRVRVLSADEYRALIQRIAPASVNKLGNASTDWQDEIYQLAYGGDYNLSISGAAGKVPYRASAGFYHQQGVLKTDQMNRASGSISLSPRLFDSHLAIDANVKFSATHNRFANKDAIGAAVQFDPTRPVRDNDPKYAPYGGYFTWLDGTSLQKLAPRNPVALLEQKEDVSDVFRTIGNVKFDYKVHFLPDLRLNVNLGYDYASGKGTIIIPENSSIGWERFTLKQNGKPDVLKSGTNNSYEQQKRSLLFDIYANYVKELTSLRSRVDLMAGYSYQDWKTNVHNSPDYTYDKTLVSSPVFPVDYPQNTLVSFYGRLNYSLMDRYLFTATVRADGSSRFSPDNRWGIFPALAFAWRMNQENFLKHVTWLDDLKLRLGYGVTGQQDGIGNYTYLPFYSLSTNTAKYQLGNTYYNMLRPAAYDANIHWETTATSNIGLDFSFLKGRLSGTLDFYHRNTKDLLNEIPVPAGSNFSNRILTNVGNIEGKGFELSITATPIQTKRFSWDVTYNISSNSTKITKLNAVDLPGYQGVPTGHVEGGTGTNAQIHSVGHAPGTFFLYQQKYDAQGKPLEGQFVDRNDDKVINEQDKYRTHSPEPKVTMGLSTSLSFDRWTLSTSLRSNIGNYIYDNINAYMAHHAAVLNSGQYFKNTTPEINNSNFTNTSNTQILSDYYLHKASFIKMDNLSLGYDFGRIFGKASLRASATVQNVFTLSPYKGIDPERAIDFSLYPIPRTYTLNLSLTL
ncbi:MAG: TonB-dependent receptor [Porphyromonadaceae bacterium]|nr:TonB-dependent receptor [Porphyromonadaceae bacterium]